MRGGPLVVCKCVVTLNARGNLATLGKVIHPFEPIEHFSDSSQQRHVSRQHPGEQH